MESKKSEIYNILKEVKVQGLDISVYQERPEVIEKMPSITFRIDSNIPNYALDRDIKKQNVSVVIDLWADTSKETTQMLNAVEEQMRNYNYLLTFCSDVPDETGKSHITTQFTY